jgi:hypothetical protein
LTELWNRKRPTETPSPQPPVETTPPLRPEVETVLRELRQLLSHCQFVPAQDKDIDKAGVLSLAQQDPFFQTILDHLLKIEKRENEIKAKQLSPLGQRDYIQEIVSSSHSLCDDSERNFVADLLFDLVQKDKRKKPTSQVLHDVPLSVWNNFKGYYEPLGISAQTILRKSTVGKNAAMIIEGKGTGLLLHFSPTDDCYSVDRFWHDWNSQAKMTINEHDLTNPVARETVQAGLAEVAKLDRKMINIFIMLLQAVHGKNLDLGHLHHT